LDTIASFLSRKKRKKKEKKGKKRTHCIKRPKGRISRQLIKAFKVERGEDQEEEKQEEDQRISKSQKQFKYFH